MQGGDIYLFKIVILGESKVGKSSLIRRLVDNNFTEGLRGTTGVADRRREIEVLERKVTLHIWDTAGQEKYRGINRMYYRGASGAILVYDLTDIKSFEALGSWLEEFKESISDGEMILVGNKVDLVESRQVSESQGRSFALKNNMAYLETSAKTDTLVTEAFMKLGESILSKVLCGGNCEKAPDSVKVTPGKSKDKTKEKSGGCCK